MDFYWVLRIVVSASSDSVDPGLVLLENLDDDDYDRFCFTLISGGRFFCHHHCWPETLSEF